MMDKKAKFVHTSVTFRTEGLVCQGDGRGIVRRSRAELDQVGSDYRVQLSFVVDRRARGPDDARYTAVPDNAMRDAVLAI